ncbi:MAG: thiamine-phosphate pyrophosphorylase [Candidatus Omnitrophica bacterium]|nr:thiamine-phosphate pyrophosphorylase [Candidatus Omnitrophota bacterium]
MTPKKDKNVYRVLDANFNRAKEGLRVCEDVCRFLFNKPGLTRKYKDIRHQLSENLAKIGAEDVIKARNIDGDVGKGSTKIEFKRTDCRDIFYANSQRVKESIRVLEEFSKLIDEKRAQNFKGLRYKIYALEKEIVQLKL